VGTIDLGADDAGSTRSAAVGDLVILTLAETPTSGYRWVVETQEASVLESAGDEFRPAETRALGAAGIRRWTFRVVGPGTARLRLVLRRAWDPSSTVDTWETMVDVER
jgi:inhibitor of cysteine peptidase